MHFLELTINVRLQKLCSKTVYLLPNKSTPVHFVELRVPVLVLQCSTAVQQSPQLLFNILQWENFVENECEVLSAGDVIVHFEREKNVEFET